MAKAKAPWFVIERSEAVAIFLLTRPDGVDVLVQRRTDDGVDLVVGLDGRKSPPTRLFVVQVKGILPPDPAGGARNGKPFFQVGGGPFHLPTCAVEVNVRDTTARYAWIAEPVTETGRATLKAHQSPKVHELNEVAVTEIVRQVTAYYDALPLQLQTTG